LELVFQFILAQINKIQRTLADHLRLAGIMRLSWAALL